MFTINTEDYLFIFLKNGNNKNTQRCRSRNVLTKKHEYFYSEVIKNFVIHQ